MDRSEKQIRIIKNNITLIEGNNIRLDFTELNKRLQARKNHLNSDHNYLEETNQQVIWSFWL